jgi:predicted transposase/invertase (TIGR01784 family)
MLGNLDNGTVFKKAFTDIEVFEHFIKDVLGFEIKVDKIETEKQFEPKIGRIAFELDIFAETTDKRMVIELQKVEYDYNFDRFLHYFSMLIAEQQKNARAYSVKRTVYLILIMTEPYRVIADLNDNKLHQEMLITTFNTEDSAHNQVPLYGHKFIALNPNHKDPATPKPIRDWLDLVYESVNNPENPKINRQNKGINKAADLIEMENLTPKELEEKKKGESAKIKRDLYEQLAHEEGVKEGEEKGREQALKEATKKLHENIKKLHTNGVPLELIATSFNLTIKEIQTIIQQ